MYCHFWAKHFIVEYSEFLYLSAFLYLAKDVFAVNFSDILLQWNFPAVLAILKLGQALTAGNVVILKPAEQTPLTSLYIAQLCKEVGLRGGRRREGTG